MSHVSGRENRKAVMSNSRTRINLPPAFSSELPDSRSLLTAGGLFDPDRPIDDCYDELNVRIVNTLYCLGINTVGELAKLTDEELLAQRNFGSKSLRIVRKFIKCHTPPVGNKRFRRFRADNYQTIKAMGLLRVPR